MICELMQKILAPFTSYLLKIAQDYDIYSKILTKKIDQKAMNDLKWKIKNYLTLLSKISYQLSRLGKYYVQELIGPWIMLSHIISKDISVHIDLFRYIIKQY